MPILLPPPRLHALPTRAGIVELAEAGRGPTALVLHGTPGGWDVGLRNAELYLGDGLRILAASRPGYLGTALSVGASFPAQGAAVAEAALTLGVDGGVLFCLSGAARAGLVAAARLRGRLRGAIVLSGVLAPAPRRPLSGVERACRDPATAPLLHALVAAEPERLLSHFHPDPELAERARSDAGRMARFARVLEALEEVEGRTVGWDNDRRQMARRWSRLPFTGDLPVLFIHGDRDRQAPLEAARRAAQALPGGRLTVLSGDHFLDSVALSEVRAAVDAFLAEVGIWRGEGAPR